MHAHELNHLMRVSFDGFRHFGAAAELCFGTSNLQQLPRATIWGMQSLLLQNFPHHDVAMPVA
jgi:hypothetical protein